MGASLAPSRQTHHPVMTSQLPRRPLHLELGALRQCGPAPLGGLRHTWDRPSRLPGNHRWNWRQPPWRPLTGGTSGVGRQVWAALRSGSSTGGCSALSVSKVHARPAGLDAPTTCRRCAHHYRTHPTQPIGINQSRSHAGFPPCPFASHAQVTGRTITSLYISLHHRTF